MTAGIRLCPTVISVLLLLLMLAAVPVSADETLCAEFSLSDAQVRMGRRVSVSMSAQGSCDIAAFVAELEYDSRVVEYKDVSASQGSAQCSVNSTEGGKLVVAWASESGVSVSDKTELLRFEFSTEAVGNTDLTLKVSQAVNVDAKDVTVSKAIDGHVSVVKPSPKNTGKTRKSNTSDNSDLADSTSDEEYTSPTEAVNKKRILSSHPHIMRMVIISLGILSLVCSVGFVAYRVGRSKRNNKEKSEVPLEGRKSDNNTDNI